MFTPCSGLSGFSFKSKWAHIFGSPLKLIVRISCFRLHEAEEEDGPGGGGGAGADTDRSICWERGREEGVPNDVSESETTLRRFDLEFYEFVISGKERQGKQTCPLGMCVHQ